MIIIRQKTLIGIRRKTVLLFARTVGEQNLARMEFFMFPMKTEILDAIRLHIQI